MTTPETAFAKIFSKLRSLFPQEEKDLRMLLITHIYDKTLPQDFFNYYFENFDCSKERKKALIKCFEKLKSLLKGCTKQSKYQIGEDEIICTSLQGITYRIPTHGWFADDVQKNILYHFYTLLGVKYKIPSNALPNEKNIIEVCYDKNSRISEKNFYYSPLSFTDPNILCLGNFLTAKKLDQSATFLFHPMNEYVAKLFVTKCKKLLTRKDYNFIFIVPKSHVGLEYEQMLYNKTKKIENYGSFYFYSL